MYKLEDNRLRSAKTSDWLNGTPISNFPIYLQELPVEDRQALTEVLTPTSRVSTFNGCTSKPNYDTMHDNWKWFTN